MELRRGGRASSKRQKRAQSQKDKRKGGSGSKGSYLARTSGGKQKTTDRGTATSYGAVGSGSAGSGRSETERLQSQLAGAQALQRRTMAQLGAKEINKSEAKELMANAMDKIRESAEGLASIAPGNTIKGLTLSDGRPILSSAGKTVFDQVMRNVTGGVGSNFDNMSRGLLLPGQNIGGREYPQGFSPYQGKDMRTGLMEFAPITQNFQKLMRRGAFLPFFMKDRLNKRADERIVDTPRTLADLGMTPDQNAQINIIETENTPVVNPQDMNLQNAVNPSFASPQDMGFLDDENIFDTEKAAIDAALTPGNVFDPVAADKQNKIDFINQVEGTDFTVDDAELRFNIDEQFERSKQKQGMIIRDDVNIEEEAPVTGQFDLTDQGAINLSGAPDQTTEGLREQIDMNTADPNLDIFTNQAFMGAGPNFPAGGVRTEGKVNTGLDMVGNKAFPSEGGSQEALDILNSNADPYFTGYPTMRFNEGGSTNKYQNMSTFEKLKMMADSIG